MGLKEAIVGRAERIVTREVPGIGAVRIRRLTAGEVAKLDNLHGRDWTFAFIAAGVLQEEGSQPFFTDARAVEDTDRAIVTALTEAVVGENSLAAGTMTAMVVAEKK